MNKIINFPIKKRKSCGDPMDDLQGTSKQDAFNQLKQRIEQGGFFNNFWR